MAGRGAVPAAFVAGLIFGPLLATAAEKCYGTPPPPPPGPAEGVEALGKCLNGGWALNESLRVCRRHRGEMACKPKDKDCFERAKRAADDLADPVMKALDAASSAQGLYRMTREHSGFCATIGDPACGYSVDTMDRVRRDALSTSAEFEKAAEARGLPR